MSVSHVPVGYHAITPYLVVDRAEAAIDFYTRAFGAREVMRLPMGDKIGHAEMKIGDSIFMLADEFPDMGILGPKSRGGPTSSLLIYTADVDALFTQALDAGGTTEQAPQDQFWGDRMGTLVDPFGHRWSLATHKEDLSEEEMQRRMAAMPQQCEAKAT
jgi:PhnB protein